MSGSLENKERTGNNTDSVNNYVFYSVHNLNCVIRVYKNLNNNFENLLK